MSLGTGTHSCRSLCHCNGWRGETQRVSTGWSANEDFDFHCYRAHTLWLQDSLVSEQSVDLQIKIRRPKVYAGENTGLGVRNNSDRGLAKLPCLEPTVIL